MDHQETIFFLQETPLFQNVAEGHLRKIIWGLSQTTYPKGMIILSSEAPTAPYLWIIAKGAVKIYFHSGGSFEEKTDIREVGQYFGFSALLNKRAVPSEIITLEETTCYLIEKEALWELVKIDATFAEHFFSSLRDQYIEDYLENLDTIYGQKTMLMSGGDRILFNTPIGKLITRDLVCASEDISIREASEIMTRNRISSLLLLDTLGIPAGIVTDKDLRDKVISKARDVHHPVRQIQSVSLVKADAEEDCIDAISKMLRYGISHLVIIEKGKLKGIVNNQDLISAQGLSPIALGKEILEKQSVTELIPLYKKISHMIGSFLEEGIKASTIVQLFTEMNDRIVGKVFEITERKMGKPPVPYTWMALGSDGRKEQYLKPDQHNILIYENPASPSDSDSLHYYFSAFIAKIKESLRQIGMPKNDVISLSENVQGCHSLETWKKNFYPSINRQNILPFSNVLNFFDFRPVHGKSGLQENFKRYLESLLKNQDLFEKAAWALIHNAPPISLFKGFIVEKEGIYKDRLNVKIKGLQPVVDLVRLLALESHLQETTTLERLRALKQKSPLIDGHAEDLEYAFEFLMHLRISHLFALHQMDFELHDFIQPDELNLFQRKTLKETFGLIARMQDLIKEKYGLLQI